MFKSEVKSTTTASAEAIWKLWADVEGWKKWDTEVEYASIYGQFKVGTHGVLKAKGAPKSKFTITEATPNKSFTSRSRLPLCTIDFIHTFENGTLTHRIEMRGVSTFFFSKIAGKSIAKWIYR